MTTTNPLREFLDSRDGKRFETQVALSSALVHTTKRVAMARRLRAVEVLDGLLAALVSAVQAAVPENEWNDVGTILADVLRTRLTVTGVR